MAHSNISIFIPHNGCKNQCSFCNQKIISGQLLQPDRLSVRNTVETALENPKLDKKNTEIAFFGGSFTAIENDYMHMLLETAFDYVKKEEIRGIRISTRPDAINASTLETLKKYGVSSIELGAQSMSEDVLYANQRGHSAEDVRISAKLIKKHGFELGLQMMTGLYKSDLKEDMQSALELIALSPDTMRIYPTVILKGTELDSLYLSGEYVPEMLENTVSLCAEILEMCIDNGIKVIKLGLHASEDIENQLVAGVYHPAFRELVEGELFFSKAQKLIKNRQSAILSVNPKNLSKMLGHKRKNIEKFKELGIDVTVRTDSSIGSYDVEYDTCNRKGELCSPPKLHQISLDVRSENIGT